MVVVSRVGERAGGGAGAPVQSNGQGRMHLDRCDALGRRTLAHHRARHRVASGLRTGTVLLRLANIEPADAALGR